MKKFKIHAGMGGGFGGADYIETREFKNEEDANEYAWSVASEIYESYMGLHGIRSIEEIMEEDDCDEEIAWEISNEERESWIDYHAEEVF